MNFNIPDIPGIPDIPNIPDYAKFIILFITLLIIQYLIVYYGDESRRKIKRLKLLIKNKSLWINFLIIIAFSIYMINSDYFIKDPIQINRRNRATKHATIALIIAILAYLELKTSAYWLIWITTYYLIDI